MPLNDCTFELSAATSRPAPGQVTGPQQQRNNALGIPDVVAGGMTPPAFGPVAVTRDSIIPTGPITPSHVQSVGGIGAAMGFGPADSGTYATYRRMGADPTIALAFAVVSAPVLANTWSFEVRRDDGQKPQGDEIDAQLQERADFVRGQLEPMRPRLVRECLRALQFGRQSFEKVWKVVDGKLVLERLKPLLPELTQILVDATGAYAGVRQKTLDLGPEKSFTFTWDQEGDDYNGRARFENVREPWSWAQQGMSKWGIYQTKTAKIISQIFYPMGTSQDASGSTRNNFELAVQLGRDVEAGKTIYAPNLFAGSTQSDPRELAELAALAGESQWQVKFLEMKGADASAGFELFLHYCDTLKFRGMLRSERTGMETKGGTKADAGEHTDTGMTDSELIDAAIAQAITASVVDDILEFNYGPQARGSVYISPAPLVDSKVEIFRCIVDAILNNPGTLEEFLSVVDREAIFDQLDIPHSGVPDFDVDEEAATAGDAGAEPPAKPDVIARAKAAFDAMQKRQGAAA